MRNNFYNSFKQFVQSKELFEPADKVLLAVSGGTDSVVMAHLFHRAGYNFGICHANFQLRGEDSEKDEAFVRKLAKNLDVPVYVKNFDTREYAEKERVSIQMAARTLRYDWFKLLHAEYHFKYVATAHHQDDLAETVILNLVKGSVLSGISGIPDINDHVIRPLLWAGKEEIKAYADYKKIEYREDKSNADSKYQRNLIRNEIFPLLKKINPDLSETIARSAERRRQIERWFIMKAEETRFEIFNEKDDGSFEIKISDLKKNFITSEIFFKWIEIYGFTHSQSEDLFSVLESYESKIFLNGVGNYQMLKERKNIIIRKYARTDIYEIVIDKPGSAKANGITFKFDIISVSEISDLRSSEIAYLDVKAALFPLTIRHWKQGDIFRPFGLKGNKKLSDFLTDLKLSSIEKESQMVVLSGNKICWVAGRRIDDRFKLTSKSQKVLRISLGN